jgi:RNA polymerase sigma-70 factor (ECF subfamily)
MNVRRIRARQNAELERLYRSRYGDFVRVATAIAGGEGRGIDAVQEAFARALRSLRDFRGEAPLEAWVWRIVVNAALEQRRSAQIEPLPEVPQPSRNGGTDEVGVRRWIATLPERQRLAIFLRYYAGLDYRSIGVALGIETGTVSATLSAAHAALRKSLEGVQL